MSLPPFNPRPPQQPKADPGEGDDVPCVKCGAVALDTGLECSECGFDNYEAITGKPFGSAGVPPSDGLGSKDAVDAQRWRWIRRNVVRMEDYAFSVDDEVEAFVDAMIAQGLEEADL